MYIYIRFLSGTDVRDRLEHSMVIIIGNVLSAKHEYIAKLIDIPRFKSYTIEYKVDVRRSEISA